MCNEHSLKRSVQATTVAHRADKKTSRLQLNGQAGKNRILATANSLLLHGFITLMTLPSILLASPITFEDGGNDYQRPIGEIRKDVKAFVKRSKLEQDPIASVGAIIDLCYLHQQIVNDPRFSTNRQLKSFRAVTATRLRNYKKEVELEILRKNRRTENEARQAKNSRLQLQPEQATGTTTIYGLNEQQTPAQNHDGEADLWGKTEAESNPTSLMNESMTRDMETLSRLTGGPLHIWNHVGGNFAPPWDHGPELVALIESTIAPESWKRNGGDGVIHYYRPLRILVITASSSVQDDTTQMLRNLRHLSR